MVVHTRATTRPGSLSSLRKTGIPTTWPTEKMHPTERNRVQRTSRKSVAKVFSSFIVDLSSKMRRRRISK